MLTAAAATPSPNRLRSTTPALLASAPLAVPRPRGGASEAGLGRGIVNELPLLRARALRLTRDPLAAEDLVQDTVERALRFEATFAPGTNLKAWLQQVLYSVFVSRCRRKRRERRALDALAADPCAWTRADAAPAMATLTPRLERALSALPEAFSSVIRLVDLGERSYRDAADELGVPVGTVMSRLFRGRSLLAVALADPGARDLAPALPRAA